MRRQPTPLGCCAAAALATEGGDVVIYDGPTGTRTFVTRTTGAESSARWARNDTHVTYVRDGNLFIVPVQGGSSSLVAQLTDVAPKKTDPRLTDSQRFIRDEEEKLIGYLRQQKEEKERAEEKAKLLKLPAFELQDRQSAADLMLSSDGVHVFILVGERPAGAKNTIVPNYVTETGYTEDIPGRTNVGDTQDRRLLAILNLKTGKSVWADGSFAPPVTELTSSSSSKPDGNGNGVGPGETQPPGRRADREIRWSMPVVSRDGRHVVASARSADNKDRWVVTLDPETGQTKVIDALQDEAWVREAGGGNTLEFLSDQRRIAFLSERDGWMHLYTLDVSAEGARPRQLTSGRWEVSSAELSRDGSRFYLTTNEVHPGERQVYTLPVDGGSRIRLTVMPGSNDATLSPDESTLALVRSYSNKPPEVISCRTRRGPRPAGDHDADRGVADVHLDRSEGDHLQGTRRRGRLRAPVHTRIIGARRDPSRPGIVFVYGAGYLQNAHRYWSTYFREYMFHNLLASRGYVVLDVDYRASAGYGRDWRTAIYRHMGGKDLEDVVDGASTWRRRNRWMHGASASTAGATAGSSR